MKKIGLLICVLAMALTSCEGPMGPPGPPGASGEKLNWEILYYTVHADDWKLVGNKDGLNSHYIFDFKESKLTKFIYEKGLVKGFRILKLDNGDNVQTPLPYVVPIGEMNGNNEKLWSEYYTYDFMPGSIAFYAYYTDFYTANKPPTCTFRIIMNW